MAISITNDETWTRLYSLAWSNYVPFSSIRDFILQTLNKIPFSCIRFSASEQQFDLPIETMKTCIILLENEGLVQLECEFLNHLVITPLNHDQVCYDYVVVK